MKFEANTIIFHEGDRGEAAFLIVKGMVEIRKGMQTSNPQILATLERNEIFGEMALFDDRPRMAEALARTNVEVIAIDRAEFRARLAAMDPVMRNMTTFLVSRVRTMADEFMRRKNNSWK
ncbi:MAG: cyclic nucleotide-binding domain-containing protein [Alphaproteobacteria bacterium]|nr:cyclic nucleotide-binding domain-containing protein [Alphaproteobacteria bacterium]